MENSLPYSDTIRSFRARHRELAYSHQEDKDNAKLKAENYYPYGHLFQMLHRVEVSNPGLLQDPDRVWNMDETSIDAEHGRREKYIDLLPRVMAGFETQPNRKDQVQM